MNEAERTQVNQCFAHGRFEKVLEVLREELLQPSPEWNTLYLAGQACRYLNRLEDAQQYLEAAVAANEREASVFSALGIILQLRERWEDAVEAFRQAIAIDPDYELAYNSLALTQKKRGEMDNALHNYDAGAKALARRIVKAMQNSPTSTILKHREMVGTLWVEYASYAALYLASSAEGVSSIAWQTGQQALDEERTEKHSGLYWIDVQNDKNETVRLFLPNYFNTFRESLRRDGVYANLIGNRGVVFELLGHHDEANQHFKEACEFSPSG